MILTEDQKTRVINTLTHKGVPRNELEILTTFKEFDYWWFKMYGYRYSLSKFLQSEQT